VASESKAGTVPAWVSAVPADSLRAVTGSVADEPAVRRATALVTVVMCLIAFAEASYGAVSGGLVEVPQVAALLVLPLLYVVPATRPWWLRHRYPLLAVQAAATYLPFAWFGSSWEPSGWLAGLILLTVPWPAAWFAAAILAAVEAAIWSGTVVTLSHYPTIAEALWDVTAFVYDALVLFGLASLTDLIRTVHAARGELADSAVTAERVRAADGLRAAIGARLVEAAGRATAALQAMSGSPSLACEHIAAAGVTAREALSEVREVAARYRNAPWPETGAQAEPGELPAPRLPEAVLVAACGLAVLYPVLVATNTQDPHGGHYGIPLVAVCSVDAAVLVVLQLRHSWPSRGAGFRNTGRPRGWPVTLLLQAVLAYALVPATGWHPLLMCGFLAGSVLLLLPTVLGRVAFAVVIVSVAVLWGLFPFPGLTTFDLLGAMLFWAVESAALGLLVYGLTRLAQLAAQLENLRGELAREAVAGERLRLARDTHDLLGMGLSAIAMKADLIGKLIARADNRAGAEIAELARICAAARADVRLVAGEARELPLAAELATARDILTSAGIEVDLQVSADPPPAGAAEILVPVVREAVTNILKHSAATCCTLTLTSASGGQPAADGTSMVRLLIANDGTQDSPDAAATRVGTGLRNLTARLAAAHGTLTANRDNGTFRLVANLPS
jgi:two-component system sensor histidine kinase DesK